jgi:phage shock protein C
MSMNEHLYRSRDDRMLAGVAGGLAEIWDADPSLIRIVWALLIFLTGGIALLVYIVMAIVVPEEDEFRPAAPPPATPPPTPSTTPASADQAAAASSALAEPGPAAEGPTGWIDPTSTAAAIAAAPIAAASTAPVAAPATPREARQAARAARRAARRERRGNTSAGIVIGAVLILLGGLFLLQEWLPAFDFDLFWPLILVGLGVVLLVVGFTRDSGNGGTTA